MPPLDPAALRPTRRAFLGRASAGVGGLALSSLLRSDLFAGPHHAAQAKRVIFLYMAGGPSHLETFDHKPKLAELHGQPIPPSVVRGRQLSPLGRSSNRCVAPQVPFARCGRSGQTMATVFPKLAAVADELCIVRSMTTDSFVHDPAHTLMCTGSVLPGRPSLGSWVWYGLGSTPPTCPASSCSSPGASASPTPFLDRSGIAAFCRLSTRASSSAPRAIRFCTSATLPA
jgi:hypothetical protein